MYIYVDTRICLIACCYSSSCYHSQHSPDCCYNTVFRSRPHNGRQAARLRALLLRSRTLRQPWAGTLELRVSGVQSFRGLGFKAGGLRFRALGFRVLGLRALGFGGGFVSHNPKLGQASNHHPETWCRACSEVCFSTVPVESGPLDASLKYCTHASETPVLCASIN